MISKKRTDFVSGAPKNMIYEKRTDFVQEGPENNYF